MIAKTFNPHVVIASSTYPLDIYPAKKIADFSGAKLIFEVHDLWPLTPMELGGYSNYHPFIKILQIAENYAYKYSYKVVSMLPLALEHMIEHGLEPKKFVYIPNGIVTDDCDICKKIPELHQNLISQLKNEKKQIIAYTGTHGIANALEYIIESMEFVQDYPVALILVGHGPEKNKLQKIVKNKNLKNIFFLPPINRNIIPAFLSQMDFLYIGASHNPLYRFGISPNKLFDYMLSAKPILYAIKAGNNIVKDANCGISVEPENARKIADAIIKLLNMTVEERNRLGQNGKNYCLLNHDYKVLSKIFLNQM